MGVGLEPGAYGGQMGKEKVVEEVDVKSADTYVLQSPTSYALTGKPVLVAAEEGHAHQHQRIHSKGARQVGPMQAKGVPVEVVGGADEGDNDEEGEEPGGIQQTADAVPMAVAEISEEEEMEEVVMEEIMMVVITQDMMMI